jgi:peptidoglycan/LPS O-acetylase OafA/YrhL
MPTKAIWWIDKMLSDHLDPDRNSLGLLRLIASLSVVISHSFLIISGDATQEPLGKAMAYNLSQQAVHVFFVVSGLTLARSWARNPDIVIFARSRLLRIFPGLLGVGLITAFAIGPIISKSSTTSYWSEPDAYLYPIRVLYYFNEAKLPIMVFEDVPLINDINAPLWTIKYELLAYAIFALLSAYGFIKNPHYGLLYIFLLLSLYYFIDLYEIKLSITLALGSAIRFAICFMLGVQMFHYRRFITTSPLILVVTIPAAVVFYEGTVGELACFMLAASIVIVFGCRRYGAVSSWTTRTDISYGTYLYAWPIQQSLVSAVPSISITALVVLSSGFAMLAATLSWFSIEKPALQLRLRPLPTTSH